MDDLDKSLLNDCRKRIFKCPKDFKQLLDEFLMFKEIQSLINGNSKDKQTGYCYVSDAMFKLLDEFPDIPIGYKAIVNELQDECTDKIDESISTS